MNDGTGKKSVMLPSEAGCILQHLLPQKPNNSNILLPGEHFISLTGSPDWLLSSWWRPAKVFHLSGLCMGACWLTENTSSTVGERNNRPRLCCSAGWHTVSPWHIHHAHGCSHGNTKPSGYSSWLHITSAKRTLVCTEAASNPIKQNLWKL